MKTIRLYVQIASWIPDDVIEEFARLLCEKEEFKSMCQETLHEALDSTVLLLPETTADVEIGPGEDVFEDLKL